MRNYKRKLTLDKDGRSAEAARLRDQGLSLRQSAGRMGISHQTVSLALAAWDERHAGQHGPTRDKLIAEQHIRRAKTAGVPWEWISLSVVAERDEWTCGICGAPVPRQWTEADRTFMPSIDHVVSIERGGAHLYSNVQLSHLCCNIRKGNGARRNEPRGTRPLNLAAFTAAALTVFERDALGRLAERAA